MRTASLHNKQNRSSLFNLFFYLLWAYTLFLLLPVDYQSTIPLLDSAWGYGLNYYFNSHFTFGPDVIFTYGPLGFLNNPQHVGNDIFVAIVVRLGFWLLLAVELMLAWRRGNRISACAFCIALMFGHRLFNDYWDYSLMALTLITTVLLFRITPQLIDYFVLVLAFGITFLLKFTAFSAECLMLAAYAINLIWSKRTRRAIEAVGLIAICLSAPIGFLIYRRSFGALIDYLKAALAVASGFSTIMSLDPFPTNISLAMLLLAILILNIVIGLRRNQVLWSEVFLQAGITWVVFRHGFVRGGYGGHSALFFGFMLVVFASLFPGWEQKLTRGGRFTAVTAILPISALLFGFIALSGFAERYPTIEWSNWWPHKALSQTAGLFNWKKTAFLLDHGADELFASLPAFSLLSDLTNTRTLVFPNSTPYVAKTHFEMFPIYSLQAYQEYSAYLDERGATNLTTARPPVTNALIEWTAIDGRNPMLDVPAMYLAFLSNFEVQRRVSEALLLKRKEVPTNLHFAAIEKASFAPGAWVKIPFRTKPIAFTIRLKQSVLGQLITDLYCQKIIFLELQGEDGTRRSYRVPPLVLSLPEIVNYVPDSLDDFEALWSGKPLDKRVTQMRLVGPGLRYTTPGEYQFLELGGSNIEIGR